MTLAKATYLSIFFLVGIVDIVLSTIYFQAWGLLVYFVTMLAFGCITAKYFNRWQMRKEARRQAELTAKTNPKPLTSFNENDLDMWDELTNFAM